MFESAKLKIKRANQHITEVNALFGQFVNTMPYEVRSDFDEAVGLYGLRVQMIAAPPPVIQVVIGDAVHNLRSALEHVASDLIALALGEGERHRSKFPMHETRKNLVDMIDKGEIKPHFPKVSEAILNVVKPYKGGNDLLWTLGKLWNIDKHRLPITTYGVTRVTGIDAVDRRGNRAVGVEAVVEQGLRVGAVASDAPLTVTNYGHASFYIQFDEVGLLEGYPVVPTLHQMSQATSQAVEVIEKALKKDRGATSSI